MRALVVGVAVATAAAAAVHGADAYTSACDFEGVRIAHRSSKYIVGRANKRGSIFGSCDGGRLTCFEDSGLADAPAGLNMRVIDCDSRVVNSRRRKLGVAINLLEDKWPNGLVWYRFSSKNPLADSEREMVRKAIQMYEATDLGVAFQECEPTSLCNNKYVDIAQKEDACYSYVGFTGEGGGQVMNLGKSCFEEPGTAVHELGHALGLYHEHTHPQREVIVLTDGNLPVSASNYAKETDANLKPYDKASIMHYGRSAGLCLPKDQYPLESFCDVEITTNCVMPKKTHCNNTRNNEIGQRTQLSAGDLNTLKAIYGTNKPSLKPTTAPSATTTAPSATTATPQPSTTTPQPSTTTPAPPPATTQPAPATTAPTPTTVKPSPTTATPAPTTPAPPPTTAPTTTTVKPSPTTATPAPTTTAPPPTTTQPTATTTAPTPTTVTPSPTTVTPAPTTKTPAPTTVTPVPPTASPEPSTVKPASTTAAPPATTVRPVPTTATPALTTTAPATVPSTTSPVPETAPPTTKPTPKTKKPTSKPPSRAPTTTAPTPNVTSPSPAPATTESAPMTPLPTTTPLPTETSKPSSAVPSRSPTAPPTTRPYPVTSSPSPPLTVAPSPSTQSPSSRPGQATKAPSVAPTPLTSRPSASPAPVTVRPVAPVIAPTARPATAKPTPTATTYNPGIVKPDTEQNSAWWAWWNTAGNKRWADMPWAKGNGKWWGSHSGSASVEVSNDSDNGNPAKQSPITKKPAPTKKTKTPKPAPTKKAKTPKPAPTKKKDSHSSKSGGTYSFRGWGR